MIPSRDFWGFSFYFLILMAFFFDFQMVLKAIAIILISLVASSVVKSDVLLPVQDEIFAAELTLRTVCVVLSAAAIGLITFFAQHYLINAKKEELEANNERVQNVLNKVTVLAEKLGNASDALSVIAQNESASTEELAATSVYIYMVPVITVVTSVLILKEKLTLFSLAGMIFTVAGLFLSEMKHHEKQL